MNLVQFNIILKTISKDFTKTKLNYSFTGKITLRSIDRNFDMPLTPRLSPIQYKMFSRLADKWIK